MEVRRRGRSLFFEGKHFRFPTPIITADAARIIRNSGDTESPRVIRGILRHLKAKEVKI